MSIKVIIERQFKDMPVPGDFQIINKIRHAALQQKGYITGETLVGTKDNSVVVLSTWSNATDWAKWADSSERAELENELRPFLTKPSTSKVYMTSAEYKLNTMS